MSLVRALRAEVKCRKTMVWLRKDVLERAKRQEDMDLVESSENALRDRKERLAAVKHALREAEEQS